MNAQQAIHRYIETHRDEHVEKLRAFLRQPGISAENAGIRESAQLPAGKDWGQEPPPRRRRVPGHRGQRPRRRTGGGREGVRGFPVA